jgi:hexulose-6-phosphate isomerase
MLGGFDGALPVSDAAAKAKQLGYEAIELCYGAGKFTPSKSPQDLYKLREELDRVGLPLASLCTGYYWGKSLSSPDTQERSEALAFTEAYIRTARALGTDAVLIVPGSVDVGWDPLRPVVPLAQVYDLAQESLRAVLPIAEAEHVTLCIENVWNKFLTGPFELAAFIDSFASPRVKAYFDVGNCLIAGYPEHWIEVLGKRIHRVHFKNFRRRDSGGTLSDFTGSLLDGDVNWPAVLKALHSIGYDGYVTAEMLVSENGMPDLEHSGRVRNEMVEIVKGTPV